MHNRKSQCCYIKLLVHPNGIAVHFTGKSGDCSQGLIRERERVVEAVFSESSEAVIRMKVYKSN